MERNQIQLSCIVERENPNTILLTDGIVKKWVPRSLVEITPGPVGCNAIIVMMPEWLAKEKGFI